VASLGEFGRLVIDDAPEPIEPDTFTFHGHEFLIPDSLSMLPTMRFAWQQKVHTQREKQTGRALERAQLRLAAADARDRAAAQKAVEDAQAEQVQANLDMLAELYSYVRSSMPDEDDWETFYEIAVSVRADMEELLGVAGQILSTVTGRPTSRPSESSDGPSRSGAGSTGSYDSPAPTGGPARTMRRELPAPPWDDVPTQRVIRIEPEPESDLMAQRREYFADLVSVDELLDRAGIPSGG
jgi:hypothetical protein